MATLKIGLVLIGATVASVLAFAYLEQSCGPSSSIENDAQAIARAKSLALERDLFRFGEIGDTGSFLRELEKHAECCGAVRSFSYPHMTHIWKVDMAILDHDGPRSFVFVELTRCGRYLWSGKLKWE
jgi:hypothetical protein